MTTEICIPWTPVKALLNLAGKNDIRTYLNGVWVDRQGAKVILWATNGAALGAYQTEEPSTDGPDLLIPRHIVEACKGFSGSAVIRKEADGRMTISCAGSTHAWADVDLKGPDWRWVTPRKVSNDKPAQFNVGLLDAFVKTRKALGVPNGTKVDGGVLIGHDGTPGSNMGALVQFVDVPEFSGVLMPLRAEVVSQHLRTDAPEWVHQVHNRTT